MFTSVVSHNQVLFQCAECGNYSSWTGYILDWCGLKSLKVLGKSLAAFHLSCAAVTAFTTCDSPQFNTLPMAVLNADRGYSWNFPCIAAGAASSATPPVELPITTGNCFSCRGLLCCKLIHLRNDLVLLQSNPSSSGSERTSEDSRVIHINPGLFKQYSTHKQRLWRAVVLCQKRSWVSIFSNFVSSFTSSSHLVLFVF